MNTPADGRLMHAPAGGRIGRLGAILSGWMLACILSLLAGGVAAQQLQPIPPLTGRVVDTTGTLSADQAQRISQALQAIEQRKGSQVVVLMVPTTRPEAIEQYGIRVADAWKIGRGEVQGKKVDDGVILLIARDDRRLRIEVGYGLEGAIPDAIASRIINEAITPRFRQGDFAGGIQAGVDQIGKLIDGEPLPAPWQPGNGARSPSSSGGDGFDWLGMGVFVLVGGLIATAVFGRFLGSVAGGLGAGLLASFGGLGLIIAVVAGVAVFLFLLVFAASGRGMDALGRGRGSGPVVMLPPGRWGGGGGFGGGGGGFGGGGGGFGGGGASGSW